ncbi:MAG: UDP-galactopyranose mutase [Melioribacteraceae bacterium]
MKRYDVFIVGAGFAGSVMAERIASQLDKKVLLVEKRKHIAGNAYDEYDENGILVHRYGPHIFHTNSKGVFNYLSKFTDWRKYEHEVLAFYKNEYFPIPINRITLNKIYNLSLQTDAEVENFFSAVREKRYPILNSEDAIVNQVGTELFKIFFENYTFKQWNKYPKELSPSVCGRIPTRFNNDCRYFTDKYQFMPKDGYTKLFERMLDHKNIEVILNTDYKNIISEISFDKMIYTGPIDYFFDYIYGKLPYRSIRFEFENHDLEYYQKCAQINYVEESVKYTRVVEHKFLSGQKISNTIISREYPQFNGEPFYPILTEENRNIFKRYEQEAVKQKNVVFCGRLAEYRYYNMDQVVANTLKKFELMINGK